MSETDSKDFELVWVRCVYVGFESHAQALGEAAKQIECDDEE